MHRAVKKFIKEVKRELPHKFRNRLVLEVGSHNINGSPRKYFWFCRYVGIDISKGMGVDEQTTLEDFQPLEYFRKKWFWPDPLYYKHMNHQGFFQVVISTEMLEHDTEWAEDLKRMYAILKPTGLLLITCAAPDRAEHGTKRTTPNESPDTTDYYRNISVEDFRSVLSANLFSTYVLQYARGMSDLQFYGIKK